MSEWEKKLPENKFIRIHRSTIINLEYVEKIDKWYNNTCKVYLKGEDESLQMSQRYTSKFLSKYKLWFYQFVPVILVHASKMALYIHRMLGH